MIKPLDTRNFRFTCDPDAFDFETTEELEDLTEFVGQERALSAIRFGVGIDHDGYNLFVMGPPGMGKRSMVLRFLEEKAKNEHEPSDWCYVNNFSIPHKPVALKLPPSMAGRLAGDMLHLVEELQVAIPAAFESDEYRAKLEAIQEDLNRKQENAFDELGRKATGEGVALLRTPEGFAFAPTIDHVVIAPGDYEKLPQTKRAGFEAAMSALQDDLQKIVRQIPKWMKENRAKIKTLNRETTMIAVLHLIDEVRESYSGLEDVLHYLDAVQQDVIENAKDFLKGDEKPVNLFGVAEHPSFERYKVNVLGNHYHADGAPIVSEENPTYGNLVGRVEHVAQLGALVTNFMLIKPGALHRANGGYLLLDARKVLSQPYAWEGLKRTLASREIRMESLGQALSLVSTVSLEPAPIPVEVKVILLGDRFLYYLLKEYDPEFGKLFKVAADFDDHMERNDENSRLYARLIATLARKEGMLPFDRFAVARMIEHGARLVDDSGKLTTQIQDLADLLREADFVARAQGSEIAGLKDIELAIEARIRRADRLKQRLYEAILSGTIMIDTSGAVVGQVNGLSVISLAGYAFAQPTRITATARIGEGELINIEREVKLSGALHSKGVLILSSYLASRYARNQPLSLSASLAFEQSYGLVEGDSASLAELCALVSKLAEAPIFQSIAVTGSVNQFGQVQAIGGVNEKIEGFFDICSERGLTGSQGVVIPAANVKHLMLKSEVAGAAEAGKFSIYAVEHFDQAIAILTGVDAGEPDEQGGFPESSINGRVLSRLSEFCEIRKSFSARSAK
ncbi:MAG: AAA family ATPase [Burkholderiales bacterium]|nr:AAA family ATPase [Burkholderiales bacterium]